MHRPGEPSVEVILDSIKRVIARESRPSYGRRGTDAGADRIGSPFADAHTEPAHAEEAAEVLDLDEDEIVAQTPPGSAEWPQENWERDADGAIPLKDHGGEDHGGEGDEDLVAYDWSEPEGLGEAATAADAAEADLGAQDADPPLTGAQTRAAMRDNLAALSMLSTLSRERQARGLDDRSIEALTRDLLRPMLAEWLDANLPPVVERLVQEEIRRIVGEQR